jgi:hypothetical protein
MKVFCAKLTTGEEIIAKLVKVITATETVDTWDTDDLSSCAKVVIEDVRQIVLQPMPGGKVSVEFMPWAIGGTADTTYQVNLEKHALSTYEARRQLHDAYVGETSRIQVVQGLPAQ